MVVVLGHCGRLKSSSSVSLTGRLRGSKGGGLSISSHRRSSGFSSGCSKKAVVRSYTRNLCSSVWGRYLVFTTSSVAHLFRLPVPPAVVDNGVIQILRHKHNYTVYLSIKTHRLFPYKWQRLWTLGTGCCYWCGRWLENYLCVNGCL